MIPTETIRMQSIFCRFSQKNQKLIFFVLFWGITAGGSLIAQPISGVWRGKITRGSGLRQSSQTVEIKFIKEGDSLRGTSYYYGSGKSYIRYAIKGWFDPEYNTVHWKDYNMIEMVPGRPKDAKQFAETMEAEADFSCPDGRTMRLDGNAQLGTEPSMKLELRKTEGSLFPDEWDPIIEGYFVGMAQKELIDSVWLIASEPYIPKKTEEIIRGGDVAKTIPKETPVPVVVEKPVPFKPVPLPPPDVVVAKPKEDDTPPPQKTEPVLVKTETPPVENPRPKAVLPPAKTMDSTALVVNRLPENPVPLPPPDVVVEKPKEEGLAPVQKTDPVLVKTESPPVENPGSKVVLPPAKTIDSTALVVNRPPEKPVTTPVKEKPEVVTVKPPPPAPPVAVAKPPAPKPNNAPPEDYTSIIEKANAKREQEKARATPPPPPPAKPVVAEPPVVVSAPPVEQPKPVVTKPAPPKEVAITNPVMEQAFTIRKKVVQKEIPVLGDSIELRFYDNAEVDGDSISLFLNGKVMFQHVRLDVRPYIFKISVLDLPLESELTMVAENLGAIPPNTAFMEAFVKGQRYTARLESTENSSGVIKLVKRE